MSEADTYKALCRTVLKRDGYKCQIPLCGSRTALHVHHIVYRSAGGPDETWNLLTVCSRDHDRIHVTRQIQIVPLYEGTQIDADRRYYKFNIRRK